MKKNYRLKNLLLVSVSLLLLTMASCKKDPANSSTSTTVVPPPPMPTTLGLYEADSSIYKLLFMPVSKIGTQSISDYLVFDTGSGGLVIDAQGILPASMITSSGFNFTGDSTIVDGITITNQVDTVEYGNSASTADKVYGNLAYASVTVGDVNGSIVIKRLPFFIYYKAVNSKGAAYDAHQFDVLGINSEYDITFQNNAFITSPFSYFVPATGLLQGFKIAKIGTNNFTLNGAYVPDVITLGLTQADISTSGFSMSQLNFYQGEGYVPILPGIVTYSNNNVSTNVLFDTGTEPYSYIEDPNAAGTALLAQNTPVTVKLTSSGFNWSYTTSNAENLTYVENATATGSNVSIIGLEFFLNNEYMLDFTDHKMGVKNN